MGVLYLDAFVGFFAKFPGHAQYYKPEDITALGETFVTGQDEVDLTSFIKRIVAVRASRSGTLQRRTDFQGIHRQN